MRSSEREAQAALPRLGARLRSRICCGLADQQAVGSISALAPALTPVLAGARMVLTHPYEVGHPDHDAAAAAAQLACEMLISAGESPPLRFEFASYHEADGRFVAGRFWADSSCPAVEVALAEDCLRRKRRAIDGYRSQAGVLSRFDLSRES